ncbi:flavin reductase family protein [Nocardiopsis terrae]
MSVDGANSPKLTRGGRGDVHLDRLREVLRSHAAGVVVVTARGSRGPVGLTATSFASVSLDPPLVSFYVAATSRTLPGLHEADGFAVHLLGAGQADLAARFAARTGDRFASPTRWSPGAGGVPLLEGVPAVLVCRGHEERRIGDHLLMVGEVVDARSRDGAAQPLVYHRRAYGSFSPL